MITAFFLGLVVGCVFTALIICLAIRDARKP